MPSPTSPAQPSALPTTPTALVHLWWLPGLIASDDAPPFPPPTATLTATLIATATATPAETATATPLSLPFAGQVVQTFPNCGLTQLFEVVHDAAGRPLPGTRLRLTWDDPNAPTLYATAGDYVRSETDTSGWDFVLATAPVTNRWRVAVVDPSGIPLSSEVLVYTGATCEPGAVNVVKVRCQSRP